jgi:hypothetical protein
MLIQQLQISFDAREDRLLLRIATAEREEIRVALTRRLVKTLWPHLVRMLAGHLAGEPAASDAIEMSDGTVPTDAPQGAGSYTEPFDGDKLSFPLGIEPVLAMESRLQAIDGPACRIMLGEIRARKVSFECDRELLLALCAMIRATVDKADWHLDLDALPQAADAVTPPPDGSPTLH